MKIAGREFHPDVLMRAVEAIYHHPDAVKQLNQPLPYDSSIADETIRATVLGMDLKLHLALGRDGSARTYVFVERGEDGIIWRFGAMVKVRDFYHRLFIRKAHEIDETAFFFYNNPTDVERLATDLTALLLACP